MRKRSGKGGQGLQGGFWAGRTGELSWVRFAGAMVFAVAILFQGTAAAQQSDEAKPAEPEAVPRVTVGEINGTPGASLMLPLYFTPDPKVPLRSLTVDIDFVSNNLKFQKASRGVATEQAGADLSTTLTDGKPDDKSITRSTLRVSVAMPAKESKQGIPDGLLAYLLFQISTEAKPFAIKLNTTVVSAETSQNPPQKVAKVNAVPGLVVVETPDMLPEATCFFFTH